MNTQTQAGSGTPSSTAGNVRFAYTGSTLCPDRVGLSVDLEAPGRQHGFLQLPTSSAQAAIAQLRIPVTVINGRDKGPTVALIAGMHGDEPEGVMVLKHLAQALSPDAIHGRIILLPALNLPAVLADTRGSAWDKGDLDACFPGNAEGSLYERLAEAVFERLLSKAELVVDLRSGGRSLFFAPLSAVRSDRRRGKATPETVQPSTSASTRESHDAEDSVARAISESRQRSEAAMIAFGAPNSVYLPESFATPGLAGQLERRGIGYLLVELGGGADVTVDTLRIAETGCRNVLVQRGVLQAPMQLRASRTLELSAETGWVYAPASGLLAPSVRLGDTLYRGDLLASVINPETNGDRAVPVDVPENGIFIARRAGAPVRAGDLIALIADEIQPGMR